MKRLGILLLIVALAIPLMSTAQAQEGKKFEGVTVVVASQTGGTIGQPILDFGASWAEETGAKIELQQFAFGDLFVKLVTAFETGSGEFDMVTFPASWAADLMGPGYLEPVPDYAFEAIQWDDVLPIFRERILAWDGVVYAFPYDGDAHMLYYRKDLIDSGIYNEEFEAKYGYPLAEPKTWKEYRDIAEFFHGRTVMAPDGVEAPIYGVLEGQKRNAQAFWIFLSRAAGYGKIPGNPCFFFSCDDMTPQVNNPGWVRALEDWIEISQFGPPEMINLDVGDTRSMFPTGVAALYIDWGDGGPFSIDPDISIVQNQVGFGVLPGATEYWDYTKNEWVTPEGGINQAPFLAFGGWVIAVAADSDVKEAAFDLAIHMTNQNMAKVLATTGGTGINPTRYSQLEDIQGWMDAGFDEESANDYLDAILTTINHPNAVLDLRITGSSEYLDALDAQIVRALSGEISPQEALDNVAAEWNNITDRLGRDAQLQQYRESVGYEG